MQKTAYEMRISDWSSDVCSSDLALIPLVTIMGLQFSFLLAGTIVIENVFYLPGLGRLVFQAIAQRDLVVVKDLVMLLAAAVVVVNLIVDLLYAVLDPRLRAGGRHG